MLDENDKVRRLIEIFKELHDEGSDLTFAFLITDGEEYRMSANVESKDVLLEVLDLIEDVYVDSVYKMNGDIDKKYWDSRDISLN